MPSWTPRRRRPAVSTTTRRRPPAARRSAMSARPTDGPLTWNVAGLLGRRRRADRDYAIAGVTIDLGENSAWPSPIEGQVQLARTNRGVLVHARLRPRSRPSAAAACATSTSRSTSTSRRSPAVARPRRPAARRRRRASPTSLRLTDHHELDLEPPVREAISLAEPIAPLVPAGLPGPVRRSAASARRRATHDHPDDDIDPRLEALRAFRPRTTRDDGDASSR